MNRILIIQLTCFLLLILGVTGDVGAGVRKEDTPKISIHVRAVRLEAVMREVESKGGVTFYYSSKTLDLDQLITLSLRNVSVSEVLNNLFGGTSVTWIKQGSNIVLKRIKKSEDQNEKIDTVPKPKVVKNLSIKIADVRGNPVDGASVVIGTTSTITNSNGIADIENIAVPAMLMVSSLGYERFTMRLSGDKSAFEVVLKDRITELKNVEVVSTGYQQLDKGKITGSVYKIDNELFNRQTGTNVLERIRSITSGLTSGPDGKNPNGFIIRGSTTFTGVKRPLIVLDNFPFEGNVETINPNDVESITVLKDAAAASIWGTKAGNGVIVITTKKGVFNKSPIINFVANTIITDRPDLYYIPRVSSADMIEFEKIQFEKGLYDYYDDLYPMYNAFPVTSQAIEILLSAKRRGVAMPTKDPATLAKLSELERVDNRDDLRKYMMRRGAQQQYAVNISGGGERINYYSSVGFDKGKDDKPGSSSNRLTLDLKSTFKISSKLEVFGSIYFARAKNILALNNYNLMLGSADFSPYDRIADSQGNALAVPYAYRMAYVDTARYPELYDWHFKPLEEIDRSSSNQDVYETRVASNINYALWPWLKLAVQYQGQITKSNLDNHYQADSWFVRNGVNGMMTMDGTGRFVYPWPKGEYLEKVFRTFKSWGIRGSLSLDKTFGEHRLIGIIGSDYREDKEDYAGLRLYGYNSSNLTHQTINPLGQFPIRPSGFFDRLLSPVISPTGNLVRLGSVFSNFNYIFRQRYFLSASGRIDQSNSFGLKANLRKEPLWSVGAGWNIAEEEFLNAPWISNLTLKLSYGFTGQAISSATSFATFGFQNSDGGVPSRNGLVYGQLISPNNPGLKWERYRITNLGIAFDMFKTRISGTIDYYKKDGFDLIGPISIDRTTGFEIYEGNGARIKNHGWDITLNSRNIIKGDFRWESMILFNYNNNRVISFDDKQNRTVNDYLSGERGAVGFPQQAMFSYKWGGLDPTDGSPRVIAGDTVTSYRELYKFKFEDLMYIGTSIPKYTGTIINNFKWRGITLSAAITYKLGYYFRANSVDYSRIMDGISRMGHMDLGKRWRKKGDEAFTNVPSLPDAPDFFRDRAYLYSQELVEKGGHIRLQDVRLNYTFGQGLLRKLNIVKSFNVFAYVSNLGVLWRANDKGIDPDAASFGSIPTPRSYSIGLNVQL